MKRSPTCAFPLNGDHPRTQYGAICWRSAADALEVLLITSRETGRWVIPKGWPIKGIDAHAAAAREAWEEAGVEGKVSDHCIGLFSYQKVLTKDQSVPCVVALYGVKVDKLSRRYPEQRQRQRKWFTCDMAATLVAEPELRAIFLALQDGSLALHDGAADTGPMIETGVRNG